MNKVIGIVCALFLFSAVSVYSQSSTQQLSDQITQYETILKELSTKKNTLANQVKYIDSQIALTTLKITQTEESIKLLKTQIGYLTQKVDQLDKFLNELSTLFLARVGENYRLARQDPLLVFVAHKNINTFLRNLQYARQLQLTNRQMLLEFESARLNYDMQKQDKEKKQTELEISTRQLAAQKTDLASQKKSKESLLIATKNDEKTYQQLLAQARAEYEAMQAIISNRGEEQRVADVGRGEKIATLINGSSTCSTGTHLHFEVLTGGARVDPANMLASRDVIWNNQPDSAFGFSGSWEWPLRGTIRVTQGYGMTYFARVYKYYGGNPHSGIDIVSTDDTSVYTVSDGELYNGSISCGGGKLRYVKVKHKDSDQTTYYLHINYTRT